MTVRRRRSVAVDARELQRQRVDPERVVPGIAECNGAIRNDGVEHVPGRIREQLVAPPAARDPLGFGRRGGCRDHRERLVHGPCVREVAAEPLDACECRMDVRVDEPGKNRATCSVNNARLLASQGADLRVGADRCNAVAGDCDRRQRRAHPAVEHSTRDDADVCRGGMRHRVLLLFVRCAVGHCVVVHCAGRRGHRLVRRHGITPTAGMAAVRTGMRRWGCHPSRGIDSRSRRV